jgi:hypothetical protein
MSYKHPPGEKREHVLARLEVIIERSAPPQRDDGPASLAHPRQTTAATQMRGAG